MTDYKLTIGRVVIATLTTEAKEADEIEFLWLKLDRLKAELLAKAATKPKPPEKP